MIWTALGSRASRALPYLDNHRSASSNKSSSRWPACGIVRLEMDANPTPPVAPGQPPAKSKRTLWIVLALAGAGCLVIPCIGIVSAIAIPAYIGYIRRSKAAEATSNLRVMQAGFEQYCATGHRLPPAAGPVPTTPGQQKQTAAFGGEPGFAALSFAPAEPVYFSYSIVAEGPESVALVAEGDLDGDTIRSRFATKCHAATCRCDPMTIDAEME